MKFNQKILLIVGGAMVAIGLIVYFVFAKNTPFNLVSTKKMDLTESVSADGKVQSAQDITLSFQTSGRIVAVYFNVNQAVKKGQYVVALDSSDLQASLKQVQATLDREQLKYNAMTSGVGEGTTSDVQTTLNNASNGAVDKLKDGYVKVDSALAQYVDLFFKQPRTLPSFGVQITQGTATYFITGTNDQIVNINGERAKINSQMASWNAQNQKISAGQDLTSNVNFAEQTMNQIQQFLTDISSVMNSYNSPDATTQALYNSYNSYISLARASVDTAFSNLITAQQTYNSSQATVGIYGIQVEQTVLESDQAAVAAVRAQIAKTVLIAPADGIITLQNAKIGEIATPGAPIVNINSSAFEVQIFVAESDIGKIKAGQDANIALDAFGKEIFKAKVISVDPAETLVNGISNYKVKLQFTDSDARIKSGMTAIVSIIVGQKSNVLAVPAKAIITQNNDKFVSAENNGKFANQKIETGITGDNGFVEIISGLTEGQEFANFSRSDPKGNN